MNENGQITIEAILILGLFIVLFMIISMPSAYKVADHSEDISVILEIQTNLDSITSAIKMVRAGGSGSVRTISIKSNYANWKLDVYEEGTLAYWVKWPDEEDVPAELTKDDKWGGISISSINGIDSSGDVSEKEFEGNGKGTWKVKVTNSATSTSPELSVSGTLTNGDTIEITLPN